MPAPAHTSRASAPPISSAALGRDPSLLGTVERHDFELQQARAAGDRLRALAAVGFLRGTLGPRLERLFGLPLRVDEVAIFTGDRAQQLETEEAGLRIDGVQPVRE